MAFYKDNTIHLGRNPGRPTCLFICIKYKSLALIFLFERCAVLYRRVLTIEIIFTRPAFRLSGY